MILSSYSFSVLVFFTIPQQFNQIYEIGFLYRILFCKFLFVFLFTFFFYVFFNFWDKKVFNIKIMLRILRHAQLAFSKKFLV